MFSLLADAAGFYLERPKAKDSPASDIGVST